MPRSDPSAFLRNPKDRKALLRVSSQTSNIRRVSSRILGVLGAFKLDEGTVFDIRLCIEEAVRNAMVHGNRSDKRRAVRVSYGIDGSRLVIEVEDEGAGFDHAALADPTAEPHITKNSGRGVYLIRKLMDRAEYNETGNRLTMVKDLRKPHDGLPRSR